MFVRTQLLEDSSSKKVDKKFTVSSYRGLSRIYSILLPMATHLSTGSLTVTLCLGVEGGGGEAHFMPILSSIYPQQGGKRK